MKRMDFDYCPACGGQLDTGWECAKCGKDWMPVDHPQGKEEPQKTISRMRGVLETLLAIELLEYHDKNFLAYQSSPKTFSEEKQALIRHGLHVFRN